MHVDELDEFADAQVLDLPLTNLSQQLREWERSPVMLLYERGQDNRVDRLKTEVRKQEGIGCNFPRILPVASKLVKKIDDIGQNDILGNCVHSALFSNTAIATTCASSQTV